MAFPNLGIWFLVNKKALDNKGFPPVETQPNYWEKEITKKAPRGAKKLSKIYPNFNFCENDYNSAVNIFFWAWSNFNSMANFDPLMANDGALKPWGHYESVFDLLAGGRDNYKSKILVQGKQTVQTTRTDQLKSESRSLLRW